jgi:hypothetical protein
VLLACGCSLPDTLGLNGEPTPWPTWPNPTQPGKVPAPTPSANSIALMSGSGPAPILPLNLAGPESPQDAISLQEQKLNAAEDERRLLAGRLAQLKAVLKDKERALAEAADDINKSNEEIAHTRADVHRTLQENVDLRDKVVKLQKEVIDLRKQTLKMMEAAPPAPKPGPWPMDREPPG